MLKETGKFFLVVEVVNCSHSKILLSIDVETKWRLRNIFQQSKAGQITSLK